ncbi:MAG: hypothetical protein Q8O00_13700 [Holophaga sp.]|nr:hypothetical protein [Holophaga sp.]
MSYRGCAVLAFGLLCLLLGCGGEQNVPPVPPPAPAIVVTTSVADPSKSAQATVIVTATLQQPVIAYNPSTLNGTVGTAIIAVTPTNTGGVAASWNISPALPAWATFNAI